MEIIQLREEMENETSNLQILQQLQHQKLANEYKKMKHIKTVSTSTQTNSKARVAEPVRLVRPKLDHFSTEVQIFLSKQKNKSVDGEQVITSYCK